MESSVEKVKKSISIKARSNENFDKLVCNVICGIDDQYKIGSEQCMLLSKKATSSEPIEWVVKCAHSSDIDKLLLEQPQCYQNFVGHSIENVCAKNYDDSDDEASVVENSGSHGISESRFFLVIVNLRQLKVGKTDIVIIPIKSVL